MCSFKLRDADPFILDMDAALDKPYNVGDRVAQLIIMPYPLIQFEETDTLSETDRGEGGHGSTGA